ncbi:hypothetical protein EJB05_28155 [Eragrostis curvula]|uniref:RIN4 pathogenic type III effector avirulence factor Avr cleavage site domain-containing protein n=1 Tax=Eragrostis curvula TaxID=38414 RepID=A0A5J9UQU5_9POAL|nr:hypothetical protein EJB05_28155 [Eragrostis curvula]
MKARRAARRQRVPAFGEWNYAYGGDWPVTQYFDSAMQAGLFVAVPPSPKPLKKAVKWSDSATLEDEKHKQQQHKVVVGLGDHGAVKKQGKQSRVADAGPHAADYGYKACRVVKAVDQDLYEIPPDMLCHKPRKKLTRRSVWLGCLGLSCVA